MDAALETSRPRDLSRSHRLPLMSTLPQIVSPVSDRVIAAIHLKDIEPTRCCCFAKMTEIAHCSMSWDEQLEAEAQAPVDEDSRFEVFFFASLLLCFSTMTNVSRSPYRTEPP